MSRPIPNLVTEEETAAVVAVATAAVVEAVAAAAGVEAEGVEEEAEAVRSGSSLALPRHGNRHAGVH